MKKFNAKKIRIAGAALAIGAAAIISTQAFADDSPSTDSTLVLPAISGTIPSILDVEDAKDAASDALEDAKDAASDALEDAKDAASDALDDDDEASDDDDEASDDDVGDVEEANDSVEEDD